MNNEAIEKSLPFHILLPMCIETKNDCFLIILKAILSRTPLDDHHLVKAIKCGMSEEFSIESEDISVNWTNLDSDSQQIRQWKLLGLWTINNFPLLAKKLFGESYKAIGREAVPVNGNSVLSSDVLNEMIFKKMKLRIIELSVNGSTMVKLKHFTKVPATIGKYNEQRVSRKMKSFDVYEEFVESCWKALKSGEFQMNSYFVQQVQPINVDDGACATSTTTVENVFPVITSGERPCNNDLARSNDGSRDCASFNTIDAPNSGLEAPPAKRACLKNDRDNNRDKSRGEGSCPGGINTDMDADLNSGSLREIILQMRDDIRTLTEKSAKDATFQSENHAQDLGRNLAETEHERVASQMMYETSKAELTTSLELIGKLTKEKEATLASNVQLEAQNQQMVGKLAEADKRLSEWNLSKAEWASSLELIEKLTKEKEATLASNVQLEAQNQQMVGKLADADKGFSEWILYAENNEKILAEWKQYADYKEEQNVQLRTQIQDMNEKFAELNKSFADNIGDGEHQKLQNELNALKNKSACIVDKLKECIQGLEKDLAASDAVNSDLMQRNGQLEHQLSVLKEDAVGFKKDLAASDAINSDLLQRIKQLEHQRNEIVSEPDDNVHSESIGPINDAPMVETCEPSDGKLKTERVELEFLQFLKLRDHLKSLKFGWMKFSDLKKASFKPGFIYPKDSDGQIRAQSVTAQGGVTDKKNIFFEFFENVDDELKDKQAKLHLNKFNKIFHFSYE